MKKAQVEIMGLVVIVILIAVGLLFAVSFLLRSKPSTPLNDFNRQLADHMVTSIVNTDTPCLSMKELIQDAAVHKKRTCFGESSEEYLEGVLSTILNETLYTWGYGYNLTIERTDISLVTPDCTSDAQKGPTAFQPLSVYPYGTIAIYLDICS